MLYQWKLILSFVYFDEFVGDKYTLKSSQVRQFRNIQLNTSSKKLNKQGEKEIPSKYEVRPFFYSKLARKTLYTTKYICEKKLLSKP